MTTESRGAGHGERAFRPRLDHPSRVTHRLYAHLAWPTLQRLPLLGPSRARSVEFQLVSCCRRLGVEPMAVCALSDRVHLVFRYPASYSPADLAHRIREGAARALVGRGQLVPWGSRCVLASVSPGHVDRLARAVRRARRSSHRGPHPRHLSPGRSQPV